MKEDANRYLITGANGFIGRQLIAQLLERRCRVKVVLRTPDALLQMQCESTLIGQIDGNTDWTNATRDVDIVIHLAARVHVMKDSSVDSLSEFRKVNVEGTRNLALQAAKNGVRRLVYVSSIKVNGEQTHGNRKFTELDPPDPQDNYGISKNEGEQALLEVAKNTGLEVVIVRPPLVYGAGVKGNLATMLKVLAKGYPLPFASVHNLRSLVYIENLVDALALCAIHPAAAGRTFMVCDDHDISTADLLCQLGEAMGHPAHLFACPPLILKLAASLIGKSDQIVRLLGSLRIDSGKIQRELDWRPPYSLHEGLQKMGGNSTDRIVIKGH